MRKKQDTHETQKGLNPVPVPNTRFRGVYRSIMFHPRCPEPHRAGVGFCEIYGFRMIPGPLHVV